MEHNYIWIKSNTSNIAECNGLLIEVRGMNTLGTHSSITVDAEVHIKDKDKDL